MAETNSTLPRGLSKRGDFYHVNLGYKGARYRASTGEKDLDAALAKFYEIRRNIKRGISSASKYMPDPKLVTRLYRGAKSRALAKGVPFLLDKQDIYDLLTRTEGRCEITGVPFSLVKGNGRRMPFSPSLDRIDSKKLYEPSNCRIVCIAANIALQDWGESVFKALAVGYVEKQKNQFNTPHIKND